MPNTINSALLVDVMRESVITVLQPALAPLRAFTTDFSADPMRPKRTIEVPKASAAPPTQVDPSDFEQGNSTVGDISVTPEHLSQTFHVTHMEMQEHARIEWLTKINLQKLAQSIMVKTTHVMAGGGTPPFTAYSGNPVAKDSWAVAEAKEMWGELFGGGPSYLTLTRPFYANLQPSDKFWFEPGAGAYGFDGIFLNEYVYNANFDGQDTAVGYEKLAGWACHPQAIGCASGLPYEPPGIGKEFIEMGSVATSIGLAVRYYLWFSTSTRNLYASYDLMYGAAVGDDSPGALVYMLTA